MEPHLEHTHGGHFAAPDTLAAGNLTDEHPGDKKSVMKKMKEKAKKLKNTITKRGHGHDDDHDDDDDNETVEGLEVHDHDDDDDDNETVEDPEVHGAPMYDSAKVVGSGGPDAILAQPRGNLEKPSVLAEDRDTEPWARQRAAPPVSTAPNGANLSEPTGLGHTQAYGQEVNPQNSRGKIGKPTGMEEDPFAPDPTRDASLTNPTNGTRRGGDGQDVNQGGLRGIIGKSSGLVEDPHAPKDPSRLGLDPSNYQTKVADPTHAGGKEASLSQIQHSLNNMGIQDEHISGHDPKTFDPNHPETLTEKISSSTSAIAQKAIAAKDLMVFKLGYSAQNPPTTGSEKPVKNSGSAQKAADAKDLMAFKLGSSAQNPPTTGSEKPVKNSGSGSGSTTDYAHTITDKVTGTLAPLYEKMVDAGSSVISTVQGTVSGPGTGTGSGPTDKDKMTDKGVSGPGTGTCPGPTDKDKMTDKGVSVKEYLVETLRPGDEDKALSEAITHTFHRGESEKKKSDEDRPMGVVTESVEVRERLGNASADKNVTDRMRDVVGSWFGGKGDAPQVTDQGLSGKRAGDQKSGSG